MGVPFCMSHEFDFYLSNSINYCGTIRSCWEKNCDSILKGRGKTCYRAILIFENVIKNLPNWGNTDQGSVRNQVHSPLLLFKHGDGVWYLFDFSQILYPNAATSESFKVQSGSLWTINESPERRGGGRKSFRQATDEIDIIVACLPSKPRIWLWTASTLQLQAAFEINSSFLKTHQQAQQSLWMCSHQTWPFMIVFVNRGLCKHSCISVRQAILGFGILCHHGASFIHDYGNKKSARVFTNDTIWYWDTGLWIFYYDSFIIMETWFPYDLRSIPLAIWHTRFCREPRDEITRLSDRMS